MKRLISAVLKLVGGLVVLVVLVLAGAVAWGGMGLLYFPSMPSSYEAKEYCSCRWTSGRDTAFCDQYIHQTVVPTQGRVVDEEARTVTATALYLSATARFVDDRQGCVVDP